MAQSVKFIPVEISALIIFNQFWIYFLHLLIAFIIIKVEMIKDLTEFSPPESDKVTLCEVDGRLRTVHYKAQNINTFTTAVSKVDS